MLYPCPESPFLHLLAAVECGKRHSLRLDDLGLVAVNILLVEGRKLFRLSLEYQRLVEDAIITNNRLTILLRRGASMNQRRGSHYRCEESNLGGVETPKSCGMEHNKMCILGCYLGSKEHGACPMAWHTRPRKSCRNPLPLSAAPVRQLVPGRWGRMNGCTNHLGGSPHSPHYCRFD